MPSSMLRPAGFRWITALASLPTTENLKKPAAPKMLESNCGWKKVWCRRQKARKAEKQADQTLRDFVRDFPKSPRVSEAWVALAELAFHAAPPRLDEARKNLAHAVD